MHIPHRVELCVSLKSHPAQAGNPCWDQHDPRKGSSAQLCFFAAELHPLAYPRAGVWLPPSLTSKPKRHQRAGHCCRDLVVQPTSLQERRVNSSLKSPVWKAAAPVAMSTGKPPLPQPTGGWGALGSGSLGGFGLPCARVHRMGSELGWDPGPGLSCVCAAPSLPRHLWHPAQSLSAAVPAACSHCPHSEGAVGALCPQRGGPRTCHQQRDLAAMG